MVFSELYLPTSASENRSRNGELAFLHIQLFYPYLCCHFSLKRRRQVHAFKVFRCHDLNLRFGMNPSHLLLPHITDTNQKIVDSCQRFWAEARVVEGSSWRASLVAQRLDLRHVSGVFTAESRPRGPT